MEARKITVVSTKTQRKDIIMSSAKTLGELKADLDAAGIDYADMTFFEGTSKTELISDESVLPKDVPYTNRTTGETKITNELVFMLTNSNKKIRSGVSRKDLYTLINEKNLRDAVHTRYGKNYTQCSNAQLEEVLNEYETASECGCSNCVEAITILVEALYDEACIDGYTKKEVLTALGVIKKEKPIDSPYDDNEIEEMFKHLN